MLLITGADLSIFKTYSTLLVIVLVPSVIDSTIVVIPSLFTVVDLFVSRIPWAEFSFDL